MIYESVSLRRKLRVGFIVSTLVLTVSTMLVVTGRGNSNFEVAVFSIINNLSNSLQPLFLVITTFGTEYVLAPVLLVLWYVRRYRTALFAVISAGAAYVITRMMKSIIASDRPYVALADVHHRATELTYAFPSGHTAFAAALATLLVIEFGGRWRWAACLWIILVAISRIYLGVHSPLDVVGGAALGVSAAISVHFLLPFLRQKTRAFLLALHRRGE